MVEVAYFAQACEDLDSRNTRAAERGRAWIPCRAAAPKFSPNACAASSAITKLTATSGSRRRARRIEIGLKTNCTMLYGHIETEEDRVDHLVRLRALQDETHGFVTFIPLAFHPRQHGARHISKHDGIRRHQADRDFAIDARQHPAYQGVLDHDDARRGANRAALRGERYRRDSGGREDLPRCRRYKQRSICDARNCCD